MKYYSTRNSKLDKNFDEIIIEGLASDGGLYMPKLFPKIKFSNFYKCLKKTLKYEKLI